MSDNIPTWDQQIVQSFRQSLVHAQTLFRVQNGARSGSIRPLLARKNARSADELKAGYMILPPLQMSTPEAR